MSNQVGDEIMFRDEPIGVGNQDQKPTGRAGWKILLVDDEPGIHEVTQLALAGFSFEERPLDFLHAYSGAEAREVLDEHEDVALALVDVVMETEHSGLDLIHHIRHERKNKLVRLVLRTGQPGQAPERDVIRQYDINDYKEKTELSSQKLFSTVYAGLRSYRDLIALEANRRGLERVIGASAELFKTQKLNAFIQGVLEQLVAILRLDNDSMYVNFDCLALEHKDQKPVILAATGRFADFVGQDPDETLDDDVLGVIREALSERRSLISDTAYTAYFSPAKDQDDVLYFTSPKNLSEDDFELVKMFCQNVAIAYKNLLLNKELEDTQREIVYMLGEAIETRSRETGSHVRRVAEYCRILGNLFGMDEYEVELVVMASPLHDFGKIGIPDAILHKPGKLDAGEWDVMRSHASTGEEMLGRSGREVMQVAAIIAGQHHEKWDGTGYPQGLEGEDIHIYARIAALADVYDALSSVRCYKKPWTSEEVHDFVVEQSGKHFDPALVDLLMSNKETFLRVRELFPD